MANFKSLILEAGLESYRKELENYLRSKGGDGVPNDDRGGRRNNDKMPGDGKGGDGKDANNNPIPSASER
jgi:hypothetical protein